MVNPPPDAGNNTDLEPDRGLPPGTPRWVKVFGIVVLVLVLVVVVIMATGVGGEHVPRRHMSSGDAAGHAQPASVRQP